MEKATPDASAAGPAAISGTIPRIVAALKKMHGFSDFPARSKNDPFRVLVSCILSQRTTDANMLEATERLFSAADTPQKILALERRRMESLVRKSGFYRQKTRYIRETCQILLEKFSGSVPSDMDSLLSLSGVGRKTANIVITRGFRMPGIAVDTHVHRISNRLGLVQTGEPDETEQALRRIVPRRYWVILNEILVKHGQRICRPIRPHCSICPVNKFCRKKGLTASD